MSQVHQRWQMVGLLGVFVLALTPVAWAQPVSQPEGWDREQSFLVSMNGQRVGFMDARERVRADGTHETFVGMRLAVPANSPKLNAVVMGQEIESADGRPIGISSYELVDGKAVQKIGRIAASQLEMTTIQGGRTQTRRQAWKGNVLFTHALDVKMKDALKADGDSFEYTGYEFARPGDCLFKAMVKRIGWAETSVNGQKVKALRITVTESLGHSDIWVDKDSHELAIERIKGPNSRMRLEACSKESVKAIYPQAEPFPDIPFPPDPNARPSTPKEPF